MFRLVMNFVRQQVSVRPAAGPERPPKKES
jgi:hypothetical protein